MKILFMTEVEFDDTDIPGTEIETVINCQDEKKRVDVFNTYWANVSSEDGEDISIHPIDGKIIKVEVEEN